jgi:SAM-dependent methyltransferase
LLAEPPADSLVEAYGEVADEFSLVEEAGRIETAGRALRRVERSVKPGRIVDLGCWTGSFLVAARDRGWDPVGIEPSRWAAEFAVSRGLDVRIADLFDHGLEPEAYRLVVACDVIEHVVDPRRAIEIGRSLLEAGGAIYLTVPNAGSLVARMLGGRWWSVLPMHVQYFTATSLRLLLESSGLRVAEMTTHAKAFSAHYYAERLGGYSPTLGGLATRIVRSAHVDERMIAPNFRDRLAVIAIKE